MAVVTALVCLVLLVGACASSSPGAGSRGGATASGGGPGSGAGGLAGGPKSGGGGGGGGVSAGALATGGATPLPGSGGRVGGIDGLLGAGGGGGIPAAGGSGGSDGGGGGASAATGGAGVAGAPAASGGVSPASGGQDGGAAGAGTGGQGLPGNGGGVGGASASSGGSVGSGGVAGTGSGSGSGGSSGAGNSGGAPPVGPDDGDGMFTIGPTFTSSPDLAMKNVPHGMTFSFTLGSASSNIFPGTDAVLNTPRTFTRAIRVYVPSQYVDGVAAPFMVSQDGFYAPLQTAVDNLVVDPSPARRVPPLVIIGVAAGGGDGPGSERGLEYDTVSDRYWRYITTEVLPAVLSHAPLRAAYPNFKLTSNPDGRGAYGCSSGAPAAFGLGWFGDFNRLLTFSGTFVDLQRSDAATEAAHPDGAWDYPSMILGAPARPLRVFLEVGQDDNGATTPESQHLNWVIANRNMAAALATKGYHYRFVYALGAGHCDDRVRAQALPDALVWLWRGYGAN